jgi:fibronectin-binding autotransporter adhesin
MDKKQYITSRNVLTISILMALYPNVSLSEPDAMELPTGANVVSGDINIQTSQVNDNPVMDINQSTQQGVIDWQSFNVGANSTVNFNQPNTSSSTLNRITGANPSEIYGKINATGEVLLVNGSGIYFSPNSQVEVGSITATTHDISNDDYLNGRYQFSENANSGSIVNQGEIKALDDYVALLAPEIRNEGLIFARMGTVALASGENIVLNFNDSKNLSSITATPSLIKGLIENRYMIEAPGGQVIMTATAVNAINGGIIKQSGIINVTQAVQQTLSKTSDGRILLSSNKAIFDNNSQTIAKSNTGQSEIKVAATDQVTINEGAVLTVDAEASNANAGTIDIVATNEINVAGNISANAKETGDGGTINTSSKEVKLEPTAAISASAGSLAGKAGTWNLEAANIHIDSAFSQVMGATVNHTNINASALQTLCGPNCDDAGALLAETDSSIHKMSLTPTKLLLHADNNLKFSGSIIDDQGSLSTKLSSFGDLSLLTLANLTSGQVSIEAQGDVTLFGSINGVSSSQSGWFSHHLRQ